jgi:hypothetical protein
VNGSGQPQVAFYCVSNESYFLGTVGMLNSLRLMGHTEPLFLLDAGLTPEQRELLAPHVTLVARSGDTVPWLLKTIAPLRHPAEVGVLIDADMILTRHLGDLVELASRGHLVAFEDEYDKFVPEWGELLGLGTARRRRYVCSGLVFLGGSLAGKVLSLMHDSKARIEPELKNPELSIFHVAFLTLDQDVLNAILCTRVESDRIVALENRLAPNPPFRGLRLLDEETLRCAHDDGVEPYVLHHLGSRKPWLDPMRHDIYSALLARLLVSEDVTVKVPRSDIPLRMRKGLLARAERTRVDARDRLGWYVRERLPDPLMERIDASRSRRRAAARHQIRPSTGRITRRALRG